MFNVRFFRSVLFVGVAMTMSTSVSVCPVHKWARVLSGCFVFINAYTSS